MVVCVHVLGRGPNKGNLCFKPTTMDSQFCIPHLKIQVKRAIEKQAKEQQQQVREQEIISAFNDLSIDNDLPVDDEKSNSYCTVCNLKVGGSTVKLECGCGYHLNCYLLIQNNEKCMRCSEKINKTEKDYHECSICLENIKGNGKKTSCGHHFHKNCINSWKNMGNNTCPNCRAHVH